ncbi:MAG: hypothetical protein AUJ55_08430 [Proteobacteria bacterium CG1_02_64_396]|nr:MAG: hypothetical protein AUJ55_08430 [Proteobacteria bacterium CG1_02_64_396]
MHTPLCRHASGSVEEYCQQALRRGLHEIGFSDHSPMPPWYDAQWRMKAEELPTYIDWVQQAQARYAGRLTIRMGLEADFHPGTEEYVADLLKSHPWDFVIGSVHYIANWGFDNPAFVRDFDTRDIDEVYRQYFRLLRQSAQSGLFDVIGHPELIKKFGHRPTRVLDAEMALTTRCFADCGIAIDVNTAGLRKPVAERYPGDPFLHHLIAAKVGLCVGSDAHRPEEVGFMIAETLAHLAELGATTIRTFQGRTPSERPIHELLKVA